LQRTQAEAWRDDGRRRGCAPSFGWKRRRSAGDGGPAKAGHYEGGPTEAGHHAY